MGWLKTMVLGGPTDKRLGLIKTGIEILGTIAGAAVAGHILKKQLGEPSEEALPETEVEAVETTEDTSEEVTEEEETK